MPSLFDDFLTRDLFSWPNGNRSRENTLPAVNIVETESSYKLEVAAPGMTKKDFKVELDNDLLLISAERSEKNEDGGENGNYTRREFSYQSFTRSFSLPERMVQGDKITASYDDGVLNITIPKTEEAKTKPRKLIKIS